MVNSGNPSKDRVTLRSCYSLHETSQKPNHRRNTFPPSTFTNEIFQRPPFRPKSAPTGAPYDLPSDGSLAEKYLPTRPHALISGPTLKFTHRHVRHCLDMCLIQQVRLPPKSPSTPRAPPSSKNPFFFTFSLQPLFLRFSVA